jgi:hypothetical protein
VIWSVVRRRLRGRSVPLLMAALLLTLGCATARPVAPVASAPAPVIPAPPDVSFLWVEPSDLAARDLFKGPGCDTCAPAPDARFTFVARDREGARAWRVRDASGQTWEVTEGRGARAEIAASRLLWAIGYHQPPTYYVGRWILVGGDDPGPKTSGRFRAALGDWRPRGTWSWQRNPFVETQPYRGLVVLMHMLGSGDLVDGQTALYGPDATPGAGSVYVVDDLRSTLGRTKAIGPVHSDAADFEAQGFVKGVDRDGHVKLDESLGHDDKLYAALTPSDVRWTCEELSHLSPRQWTDAFRAAHYEPATADRIVRRLQDKVRMGLMLGGGGSVARTAGGGRP